MRTAISLVITLAVALFVLAGSVFAQGNTPTSNPYMPADPMYKQQQMIQNVISAFEGNGNTGYIDTQGQPQGQMQKQEEASPFSPDPALARIQAQQEQEINDIARERADREFEIKALKNVLEGEIHDLQRKIDEQQREIDSLKHAGSRY